MEVIAVGRSAQELLEISVRLLFFLKNECLSQQKSNVEMGPKMSLAERMKILKDKEEQWKSKGKGAANDSVQFTVAGRMAKKGRESAINTV